MPPAGYSLLRPDLLAGIGPLVLALAALTAVSYFSLRVLVRRVFPFRGVRLGTRGTAEMEFTLALPVFLTSILTVIQVALMIDANLLVDYAAFTAARSAIVWIPRDEGAEGPGVVNDSANSPKRRRIQRAAVIGCLPISPRITDAASFFFSSGSTAPIDASTLAEYTGGEGGTAPMARVGAGRLALDILERWPYASRYTNVELLGADGEQAETFPSDGTVTVRVTHDFLMQVPLAGALLGATFGERFVPFVGPYHIPISSTYTLMLAHQ